MTDVLHKGGTRAALDALAASSDLLPRQIYVLTDEGRIAVATSTSTYETFAKEGDGVVPSGNNSVLDITKLTSGADALVRFNSVLGNEPRAEVGLNGKDSFSISVSANGDDWVEPLVFNASTGTPSGSAVQSSATDQAAGKLALSEHALMLANITGTLADGNSVIEEGSNLNGEYTMLENGFLIMSSGIFTVDVTIGGSGIYYSAEQTWTFPKTATVILGGGVTSTFSTLNGGNLRTNGTTSATFRGTRLAVSGTGQAFRCWAFGKWG